MHVNTGIAKGRQLQSVPNKGTRPITDRAKQALFNILADDVKNSTWLDMFGGTGAVGIEALSRGASNVTFIDTATVAVRTIQTNLKTLGFDTRARALKQDALQYINAHPNMRYDFIYVAPPQYLGIWLKALLAIDKNAHWLTDTGTVICQINPTEFAEVNLQNLELSDERRYGKTMLAFFDRKAAATDTTS